MPSPFPRGLVTAGLALALCLAPGGRPAAQAPPASSGGGTPPAADARIDATTRQDVLLRVADIIEHRYPDPLVAKAIADTFRDHVSSGAADGATDSEQLVAEVLGLIDPLVPDGQFAFRDGLAPEDPPARPVHAERSEDGLRTVRNLENGITYLELDGLPGNTAATNAVARALAAQPETRTVILDLRDNVGGSGDMVVLLCSHLLEADTVLYTFSDRSGEVREMRTFAPPRHYGTQTPVFVLTSGNTHSSAEALAFILQEFGRAVVIGERTPGLANPVNKYPVANRFELAVPFVLLRYGPDGASYSGVGVAPDVEVAAESALEVAIERAQAGP